MAFDTFTLCKLIILYMLDRVNSSLTNSQISQFVLGKNYTDYFTLNEVIDILISDSYIVADSHHHSTHYTITDVGKETIDLFRSNISSSIITEINAFLSENNYEIKEEVNNISEYYMLPNGDYAVHCLVKEHDISIIDLTVTVPDEHQADAMCGRWKDASTDIYGYIMTKLL